MLPYGHFSYMGKPNAPKSFYGPLRAKFGHVPRLVKAFAESAPPRTNPLLFSPFLVLEFSRPCDSSCAATLLRTFVPKRIGAEKQALCGPSGRVEGYYGPVLLCYAKNISHVREGLSWVMASAGGDGWVELGRASSAAGANFSPCNAGAYVTFPFVTMWRAG